MPSASVMELWTTVQDAVDHYKIDAKVWEKVAENLGDPCFQDIGLFAGVDDADFRTARDTAGVSPLVKGA